ncbi:hypothetical protein [Nocardiopsis valliformis]|uniref:hypothetical protein n=1 Tax=Nocardiopsis valliformis TaxID=239974 RepID=UPI00036ADA24|nr:hypothetical protein [Nocardiopsis valliformis]
MLESDLRQPEEVFPAYAVDVGSEVLDRPTRNSIGGWPFLNEGQEWPECFCGERLLLFFQLDLPLALGPFGGDHLLVFHCRTHNDAAIPEKTDGRQLMPEYWNASLDELYPRPFWRVLIQRRAANPSMEPEYFFRSLPLMLRPFEDIPNERGKGDQIFKVGGMPSWAQDPEYYRCACGADLVYVCQVPEGMGFAVVPGQPEQPDGGSPGEYELFLGNEVYLLACPEHCDPAAAWPVTQN